MKRMTWMTILMVVALALGSVGMAHAEIIPARGYGQIGLTAYVLCDELTVRQGPSASSRALETLHCGDFFLVDRQEDGWAHGFDSDSEYDSVEGWVNADYIIVDPALYVTEGRTPVYAWDDEDAPKVALLGGDQTLPILKEEGDWLLVSLRGATGWIHL